MKRGNSYVYTIHQNSLLRLTREIGRNKSQFTLFRAKDILTAIENNK